MEKAEDAGTAPLPDNIRDCQTPCLGAFAIILMMLRAKSLYAVRAAASCDMCINAVRFWAVTTCYRELNQCEPQPATYLVNLQDHLTCLSGRFTGLFNYNKE